jgi:hypothetical protein
MEHHNIIHLTQDSLMNRLFCSFTKKEDLDNRLYEIVSEYKILYNKIFVLSSPESEEYLCTYNIEVEGPSTKILQNTILLHRKKETNTLYTINALNSVVKSKNNGVLDNSYQIDWQEYKNSVLLTQPDGSLRKLNTAIHKIVNL